MTSTLPYRQVRQKAIAGHNAMPTTRLVLISPLLLTRRFQEVIERLARGCSQNKRPKQVLQPVCAFQGSGRI